MKREQSVSGSEASKFIPEQTTETQKKKMRGQDEENDEG